MTRGQAEFTGRIHALTLPGVGAHPTFKVQVENSEGAMELIFVGSRSLPGFQVGRHITARGRLSAPSRMYNPRYWLEAETDERPAG
ncbi:OB-fold nucleic acid binding domain-containing protein [Flaviflexus huanghaiensis]|uniref:OB-fold nucleic acid binding domain-containing protein n=1 Tax=Flaviflexus huanghaiensis TaxID=1111473 RepID=UPI0015F934C4|nr:OB-fold nucleic acid binding domain-containing protein [Flaviflexus huanghaiensis]